MQADTITRTQSACSNGCSNPRRSYKSLPVSKSSRIRTAGRLIRLSTARAPWSGISMVSTTIRCSQPNAVSVSKRRCEQASGSSCCIRLRLSRRPIALLDLQRWLGGARYGMFDRATEMAQISTATPAHPVSRGLAPFTYLDEFYPTLRWQDGVQPILKARLHVEFREGKDLVIGEPVTSTVAWVYERAGGGRAFGYTGAHYLAAFDQPTVRKMILNAIAWTARIEVPAAGISSHDAVVTRAADRQVIEQTWGRITWYASGPLGNSATMTVGEAVIKPGQENPRHYHPNCDEILHVVRGRILHSMGTQQVEMTVGDTVSIPTGVRHNARNIGTEDAVLAISFSSAHREVIGE